jgi:hypothetical protein
MTPSRNGFDGLERPPPSQSRAGCPETTRGREVWRIIGQLAAQRAARLTDVALPALALGRERDSGEYGEALGARLLVAMILGQPRQREPIPADDLLAPAEPRAERLIEQQWAAARLSGSAGCRRESCKRPEAAFFQALCRWAILDSNQGPLPYQRSALTD